MLNKIEADLVIIGAGPVGIFAAFKAGLMGIKCLVVDANDKIGGQCSILYPEKPIFDIPGYPKILAKDLISNLYTQSDRFNIQYYLNSDVTEIINDNNLFILKSKNNNFVCKAVIFATGAGLFSPNKIPIRNASVFENKTLLYSVKDTKIFNGKNVIICGGGDSALDWCIELSSIAREVILIHRRDVFTAFNASVLTLKELVQKDCIKVKTPFAVTEINGEGDKIKTLKIKTIDGTTEELLTCDYLLAFFGLTSKNTLGDKCKLETKFHSIVVNSTTMESSKEGIFAIGDCCIYPNKLKLILCGFSEAAIAMQCVYERVFQRKAHFQHSTSIISS
jgi:thioredoxin reductase (NADPH)